MHSGPSVSCRGGYALETMDLGGLPIVANFLGSSGVVLVFRAEIGRKKMPKSACSSNTAFGRSISSQGRKSATSATKTEAKNDSSFIKCMRGKLNARREVLKAIQDYHINAEARAQLQKRAREFEQEKKQKQRRKAASQKQAAMEKNSRQSSVVNTLLK
ncbi:hypothetical protein L7F22_035816 [Adiantum nelumboides]|nr:hypothetical protein [Adiantum nelumboides]